MRSMYYSPAKINLFLEIQEKRADGYHELATLIQTVSLFDHLEFALSTEDRVVVDDPKIPSGPANLAYKALTLFKRTTNIRQCYHVHIKKNIPTEAGLGGGSSNAATTLFVLNEKHGRPLKEEALMQLGQELGSDVPAFFSSGTAYCTGRGEKVTTLPMKFSEPVTLVVPPFGLSTALVYKNWSHFKAKDSFSPNLLSLYNGLSPMFYNDLEEPAFLVKQQLKEIKEKLLQSGFDKVVMTGSGSCLFCLGTGNPEAYSGLKIIQVEPIQRKVWYEPEGSIEAL